MNEVSIQSAEKSYLFPNGIPKRNSKPTPTPQRMPVLRQRMALIQPMDLGVSWFWGLGSAMTELKRDLDLSLRAKLNVLLVGETGTGKELLAKKIHTERKRQELLSDDDAPFVSVNCSTIPESLAESILFGHERGAFTSAREKQPGKFELAKQGTLFLDEIQNLPLEVQVKLLRALQEREVERLGGKNTYKIECKIIAATNVPLELLVEQKKFRKDLYYRLSICPLYIPAVRHRKEDFPLIVKGILNKVCAEARVGVPEVSPDAFELMLNHQWPGNIRELEHALTYCVIRADEVIEPQHLPPSLTGKLSNYLTTGDWI